jgi:phosphoglycolate phosphatase
VLALSTAGVELEEFYRRAFGRDPSAPEHAGEVARFVEIYRATYFDNPEPGQPYPEVADTLARLRRRRPELAIAVATTKRTDMARRLVDRAGLMDRVDHVQGSDGLPKKPDPAVLIRAAAAVGGDLAAAAMVGDTNLDIGAARAAGCTAIGVTWGGWGPRLAEAEPDHLIERFSALESLICGD